MKRNHYLLSIMSLLSFLLFTACGETSKSGDDTLMKNNNSQTNNTEEFPYEIITDNSGKEFVVDEQGNQIPMNESATVEVLFELGAPVDEDTLIEGDSLESGVQGQGITGSGHQQHGGQQHQNHGQQPGQHGNHLMKGQHAGIDFNVDSAFLSVEWLDFGAFKTLACHNPKLQHHQQALHCDKNSARVEGPMIVDLLAGTSTPSFTSLNLPSGAYRSVGVKVEPADTTDGIITSTDTMNGLSLWVSGNFEYNSQPVNFELQLSFERYLVLARHHGMIVSPLEPNQIVIGFNVEKWFDNIPVKQCIDKGELTITNNTLVIDNASGTNLCKNMLHRMAQNIHKFSHIRHVMKHVH